MPNVTRCKVCVFWEKIENTTAIPLGLCRCDTPTYSFLNVKGEARAVWPVTKATDGCGKGYKQ